MLIIISRFCLLTRLALFLFQVLVSLLPDHEADAFIERSSKPHPWIVENLFGGFDNWDSQYYITIADKGYTEEQFLAFFPFYPLLMRFIASTILHPLSVFLPFRSLLLISGYFITNMSFLLATFLLYRLTNRLTSNPLFSLYSCFFFCLNPASVFMCSLYTESLFSCFCFAGMLAIIDSKPYTASLLFGISTAIRSNGVLNVGFILYFHFQDYLSFMITSRRQFKQITNRTLRQLLQLVIQVSLVLLPFFCFQVYSYLQICAVNYPNTLQPTICNKRFPLVYSYIQNKYWNLGFMSYYEIKQIPNFLLAIPMALLILKCIKMYFDKNTIIKIFSQPCIPNQTGTYTGFKGNLSLIPFMVHGLFLLVVALTMMHVQVITRFVCSSTPIIYWFSSALLLDYNDITRPFPRVPIESTHLEQTLYTLLQSITVCHPVHFIVLYSLSYILLGFTLHCNFLPWT